MLRPDAALTSLCWTHYQPQHLQSELEINLSSRASSSGLPASVAAKQGVKFEKNKKKTQKLKTVLAGLSDSLISHIRVRLMRSSVRFL